MFELIFMTLTVLVVCGGVRREVVRVLEGADIEQA
jgi:hypothetical protein